MMAKAPAPPEPEARFAVLPNDKRDDLEKLRAKFGRSHLIMGLAYARTGLLAQAQSEFEQLTKENPKSELAKNLRASLANAHPKVGASGR
jgi:Tfp pilus assembly protein PilF